jgi:tetratricopeptide (TPR) repeat protein
MNIYLKAAIILLFLYMGGSVDAAENSKTPGKKKPTNESSNEVVKQKASAVPFFREAFDSLKTGDYTAAAVLFERGLSIEPNDIRAMFYYGESLEKLGKEEQAIAAYGKASEIAPGSVDGIKAKAAIARLDAPIKLFAMTNGEDSLPPAFVSYPDCDELLSDESKLSNAEKGKIARVVLKEAKSGDRQAQSCHALLVFSGVVRLDSDNDPATNGLGMAKRQAMSTSAIASERANYAALLIYYYLGPKISSPENMFRRSRRNGAPRPQSPKIDAVLEAEPHLVFAEQKGEGAVKEVARTYLDMPAVRNILQFKGM